MNIINRLLRKKATSPLPALPLPTLNSAGAKAVTLVWAFSLTLVASSPGYADDIEIYLDRDQPTEVASSAKPNILFILDTSGSMKEPEVVSDFRPPYDPNVNYGTSNNADMYIYDSNRVYTGMSVPQNKNKCADAKNHYKDNPAMTPNYLDKVLVWEQRAGGNRVVKTCPLITQTFSRTLATNSGLKRIAKVNVTPGDNFKLTYTTTGDTNTKVLARARFRKKGSAVGLPCGKKKAVLAGENTVCDDMETDIVPAGAKNLVLRARNNSKDSSVTVTVTLALTDPACTETATVPVVSSLNWETLVRDSNDIKALECSNDHGVHGRSDGSPKVYPQYQPVSAHSNAPKYVDDPSDPDIVQWSNPDISQRYLFPGNYHDYLQAPIDELVTPAAVVNSDAEVDGFCKVGLRDANGYVSIWNNAEQYVEFDDEIFFCQSRVGALKQATAEVLSTLSHANVGMMRFNHADGGTVLAAVGDIDSPDVIAGAGVGGAGATKRQELLQKLIDLPASGATPLQESLHEAYLYFSGGIPKSLRSKRAVKHRNESPGVINPDIENIESTDISGPGVHTGGRFIAPIKNECQDNNIILFSDGTSNLDKQRANEINAFAGTSCNGGDGYEGDCLDDLAEGLATKKVNVNVEGDNHVYLHTIGFGAGIADNSQLLNASNKGLKPGAEKDSQHYDAANATELTAAFQAILSNVSQADSGSFVAPAVTVNAFNRTQFRDDLYFALFKPSDTPRWHGNIKKYKLNADAKIVDANDNVAVDDATGLFYDSARSIWSDPADVDDGASVILGGAAQQLDASRTLFASLKTGTQVVKQLKEDNFLDMVKDAAESEVNSLGAIPVPDQATNEKNIVNWSLGKDVDSELGGTPEEPNYFLGDSLHSSPFLLNYGTRGTPKDMLFSSSNQGMLHAIDGETGEEKWAYIPDPDLFANLGAYYNQIPGANRYGTDSEMEFSIKRNPLTRELEEAHLFVGQRRGGNKYFALDVSNAFSASSGNPVKKLWTLHDLPRMGQSWAKPVSAKINFCTSATDDSSCAEKDVLVIAGGYDTQYDNSATPVADMADKVKGNAIYIVDRMTGELLWMAGKNDQVDKSPGKAYFRHQRMTHSFPSEPTVIDADFDGVADLMFAIDITGRIWRFDFSGGVSSSAAGEVTIDENDIRVGDTRGLKEVAGGIIADLSEPGVNRRFYNKLDISFTSRSGTQLARYNIVTGSGYRAHPLHDEGQPNRLYFVFDRHIQFPRLIDTGGPTGPGDVALPDQVSYKYVTAGNVSKRIKAKDIPQKLDGTNLDTTHTVPAIGTEPAVTGGEHEHGFYIELEAGEHEKMLNPTITNAGTVVAVSYAPNGAADTPDDDSCRKSDLGRSFLYFIDLATGEASKTILEQPGMSPAPVVVELVNEVVDASCAAAADCDTSAERMKVLLIGTQAINASKELEVADDPDSDIGRLVTPGLKPSDVGRVYKKNWWERRD